MEKKKRVWLFILAFSLIGLLVYGAEIAYAFMKDRNKKMDKCRTCHNDDD